MPWREVSLMDQRREFMLLFQQADVNRRELCRRFGISSKTAYKWLARAAAEDKDWAQDRSRRPRKSPARSTAKIETAVLEVRALRGPSTGSGAAEFRHHRGVRRQAGGHA